MSYATPQVISADGRTIRLSHQELPDAPNSYLTASVSATGTTLTVKDNNGFANGNFVRVGVLGEKGTELVAIGAAVSRGTSLTVAALKFDHANGSPIEKVQFDQWRIYGNSTNSTSGATLVATIDVQFDSPYTTYVNTSTEYAFYFARAYDSVAATNGDVYSDGIEAATNYGDLAVGRLIREVKTEMDSWDDERITDEWFFVKINDCLRYITGKLKRWSTLQVFDYSLGAATRGFYGSTLPTDIEDPNSNKSIIGVRIGTGQNLDYRDKREWENDILDGVVRTQVRTQASAADTTLDVDNSYDFTDSGSVNVYVSGTKYTITYTGVTRSTSTGVLTGIPASGTGSISVTIPVDTNVWQGEDEGEPRFFTVYDGSLYSYPLPDSAHDNTNVSLDYHSKRTRVDSYGDTLETRRYDAVKYWLKWQMRARQRGDGKLDMQDGDKLLFDDVLVDSIRTELGSQRFRIKPVVRRPKF